MIRNWKFATAILVISACNVGDLWARGFGGGGGERGGYGGGERGGSYGGQRGGYGGGERGGSGGGGGERGGYGGGNRSGGEQNRGYGGNTSRYGEGNNERYGGGGESRYGAGNQRYGNEGNARYGAAGGNEYRGGGSSPYGNAASGQYPRNTGYGSAGTMNRPQGYGSGAFPSDAGMHTVANSHPYSNQFSGANVNAGNFNRNPAAAGNAVQNYRGGEAGAYAAGAGAGYRYASPSAQYANASAVRSNFNGAGMYSGDWYGAHPGAWAAAGTAASAVWAPATWGALNSWYGGAYGTPTSYDYGSNVVYNNNSVYVDGQNAGTSDQFYNQAVNTATTVAPTPDGQQPQWMSLGVFAATPPGQNNPIGTLQLSLDKVGNLRGNFIDTASGQVQTVSGTADQKSQRVAFTIGDKIDPIVEAGLYNLTKPETTALVHHGKDRSDQWLLVRLNQQSAGNQ